MSDQPQKSWFGRNWIWIVPTGCLIPILLCGGFIVVIGGGVFAMMKSSEPYQESLARVQADPRVQAITGTPIEPGFMTTGNIQLNNDSGDADISYSVSGPQGSGTVSVVAQKSGGTWQYMTMEFSGGGEQFSLLEE